MVEAATEPRRPLNGAGSTAKPLESTQTNERIALGDLILTMADGWGRLFVEGSAFMAERMRVDARALSLVLSCRSLTDFQDVQAAVLQKAVEDYQAEAGRIAALMDCSVRAAAARALG